MKITKTACPICGKENERIAYWDAGYLAEEHYHCDRCSYFREMCYSPSLEGICDDSKEEYIDKALKMGLAVYPREEVESMF